MVIDATGKKIAIAKYQRIVSLVPSITQTLFDIGCQGRVVGVTNYCISPPDARNKPKVGGTKTANFEKIMSCKPDLVIANMEENTKELIVSLRENVDVFVTFPKDFGDNINLLHDLGHLLDVEVSKWVTKFREMDRYEKKQTSVFCPIWKNPWMSINRETYINGVLDYLGLDNICEGLADRYPVVSLEGLPPPDLIILPDEPFHFKEKDAMELHKIFPESKICLVDGRLLSWFGTFATNVNKLTTIHNWLQTKANDMITIG